MKIKIAIALLVFLAISCGENKTEQLKNLNGYWEIVSVEDENGMLKEFKISTTVEHIYVENNGGKRTKVMPQLDGTFKENGNVEVFEILNLPENITLKYTTPFASWTETILEVTNEYLVVLNEEGKKYTYKRFEKFNFE